MGLGRPEEAERQFRLALAKWPNDAELKLGLGKAFQQQGKSKEAAVVLEGLVRAGDAPAGAHLLLARILLSTGEVEEAVRQYKNAVAKDPGASDPELAGRLGVHDETRAEKWAEDEDSVVDGRVRASWEGEADSIRTEIERPKVSFKDVGGMESVKDEIRMKIIHPLTHADLYQAYGKAIGGGILLYGPPGCGKTHLARATAGEIRAGFIAVGINDVLDMWIGNSERNLHEIFAQARRNKPCVLFFDEVDALGASRSDMRHSTGRQLINQFLAEMDGVQTSNDGVLILAATNAPWHLDPAFRRPGRFDRILFVPPPDSAARAAILRIHLRGKPVSEIDYDSLGRKTEKFSGADLKALIDVAVEQKLREALRDGVPKPLSTKDLAAAAASLRPSTQEWFSTARNHALYANQGGIYDDILKYLKM
jgi:SpoVK/Ycf46/Vps4 family AAA+-type ATPase